MCNCITYRDAPSQCWLPSPGHTLTMLRHAPCIATNFAHMPFKNIPQHHCMFASKPFCKQATWHPTSTPSADAAATKALHEMQPRHTRPHIAAKQGIFFYIKNNPLQLARASFEKTHIQPCCQGAMLSSSHQVKY